MKNWRNKLSFALCLALCLILLAPAAQAAGDRVTALAGKDGFEREGVEAICAVGDSIWMQDAQGVHVYDALTGEAAHYPWSEEYRARQSGLMEEGEKLYSRVEEWFSWNGAAYALASTTRTGEDVYQLEDYCLCRVVLQNGEADVEKLCTLDWKPLEQYDSVQLERCCAVGDVLCAQFYSDTGKDQLALIPLDGSATRVADLRLGQISGLCPDGDGLLVLSYDYDREATAFLRVDVESGEASEIASLEGRELLLCPARQADGRIVLVREGRVALFDPDSGACENLAGMPISVDQAQGCLTSSGVYAAGNFSGVALIDTQNRAREEMELVIRDLTGSEVVDRALLAFTQAHPEISVVKSNADADVLDELLTRSDEVDIYILYTASEELSAIQRRQWGAPIESEAVAAFVEGLYPGVAQACTGEEGAFMLPLSADVLGMGVNVGALKALNLSIEETPTDWPGFLDFLNALATDECPVPLVAGWSAEDIYADLAERILLTYVLEVASGASDGYDTPELRAAFEALDRLDCEKLAEISASCADYAGNPLINTYNDCGVDGCTFRDEYDAYHLLLSISADRPVRVPVSGQVALINPASAHVQEATAFLEQCVACLSENTQATLSPEQGEALRSPQFEAAYEQQAQQVASLEGQLAGAEEENRQALEEELQRAREWLERMEDYYWIISQQSLEWYRAHDDDVRLLLSDSLDMNSVYDQARRAAESGQGSESMLTELQRQADMRRLEE